MNNLNNIKLRLQKEKNLKILLLLFIFINIFLLIYLVFGFSKVSVENSQISTYYVNENKIDTKDSVKLRPGKYTIRVANKDLSAEPINIRVWPFIASKIKIEQADPNNIYRSSTDKPFTKGDVGVIDSKYSNDGNWLIAKYEEKQFGNQYTLIIKYTLDQWQTIAYYPNENGEMDDEKLLLVPSDVIDIYNIVRQPNDED